MNWRTGDSFPPFSIFSTSEKAGGGFTPNPSVAPLMTYLLHVTQNAILKVTFGQLKSTQNIFRLSPVRLYVLLMFSWHPPNNPDQIWIISESSLGLFWNFSTNTLFQVLKKISSYIQEQNEKIYTPRGLLLTDPIERGMRVVSFTPLSPSPSSVQMCIKEIIISVYYTYS